VKTVHLLRRPHLVEYKHVPYALQASILQDISIVTLDTSRGIGPRGLNIPPAILIYSPQHGETAALPSTLMAKIPLEQVRRENALLVNTKPFVAVVAGGTAGIGECAVRQLAETFKQHGDKLRLYMVGRNQDAADNIIADCRRACAGGQFRFVKGDLTLIRQVDRVCADIIEQEEQGSRASGQTAKIDLLVASQGLLGFRQVGESTNVSEIPRHPSR
jgi:hypothetical protein